MSVYFFCQSAFSDFLIACRKVLKCLWDLYSSLVIGKDGVDSDFYEIIFHRTNFVVVNRKLIRSSIRNLSWFFGCERKSYSTPRIWSPIANNNFQVFEELRKWFWKFGVMKNNGVFYVPPYLLLPRWTPSSWQLWVGCGSWIRRPSSVTWRICSRIWKPSSMLA